MSNKEAAGNSSQPTNVIQLRLSSLMVLCAGLVAATAIGTGALVFGLIQMEASRPNRLTSIPFGQPTPFNTPKPDTNPPWGELIKLDLEVEQPDEYVAFEPVSNRVTQWFFPGQTP